MNIKQFYTIKALGVLPPELIHTIWKKVLDGCADTISKQYFRRVAINNNFYMFLLEINKYTVEQINFILDRYQSLIMYGYIQDPISWVCKIENILDDYWHLRRHAKKININNLYEVYNNIMARYNIMQFRINIL